MQPWPAVDRNLGNSYLRFLQATRQVLIDGDYEGNFPTIGASDVVVKKLLLLLRSWSMTKKLLPSTTDRRTEAWGHCRTEARRSSEIINFMVD